MHISRRERRGRREMFWGCDFAQRMSGDFIVSGYGVKPQFRKIALCGLCALCGRHPNLQTSDNKRKEKDNGKT